MRVSPRRRRCGCIRLRCRNWYRYGSGIRSVPVQGIYCPETSASKNSRQASNDAISAAGTTFGGLVGDLASTVLRTGASIARSASGEVSVSVVSGYEFYLVKSERK